MVQNLESPGLSGRVDSTRDGRIVSPSSKGIYVYVDTLVQIEPEYYGPISFVQSGRLKFYPFLVHLNLGGNVRHPGTLNTREIWVQNKVIRNFMELLDFFQEGGGGGAIVGTTNVDCSLWGRSKTGPGRRRKSSLLIQQQRSAKERERQLTTAR